MHNQFIVDEVEAVWLGLVGIVDYLIDCSKSSKYFIRHNEAQLWLTSTYSDLRRVEARHRLRPKCLLIPECRTRRWSRNSLSTETSIYDDNFRKSATKVKEQRTYPISKVMSLNHSKSIQSNVANREDEAVNMMRMRAIRNPTKIFLRGLYQWQS